MKQSTYKYVYIVSTLYCYINSWTVTRASICDDFSSENYPNEWPYVKGRFPYPIQSPNDIPIRQAKTLIVEPLEFYLPLKEPINVVVLNTGYFDETGFISLTTGSRPFLTNGPLFGDKYELQSLHFHWSNNDLNGSEFSINGCSYSMEMHVVFYNCKYKNITEAKNHPDGIAVMGFLGEISEYDNPDFDSLISSLPAINTAGTSINSTFELQYQLFLALLDEPEHVYYTFPGSLTTPNYYECVTWLEFTKPTFKHSHKQLQQFRQLKKLDGTPIVINDRAKQDFKNRPLFLVKEQ